MSNKKNKTERYEAALRTIRAVLGPEGYQLSEIGHMATISSILAREFPEWIFTGFYRVIKKDLLEIGPYQGPILACGTIEFGRGVCGTSARTGETVIVRDVSEFPGYISCDSATRSEIVVPVFHKNRLIAVLDIDSAQIGDFDETDRRYLEKIVAYI